MKKILFSTILSCFFFTSIIAQMEAKKLYESFFPIPVDSIPFPIINGNKVKNYFTSYKNAVAFIENIASKHTDLITVGSIGKTQQKKNQISITFNKKNSIPDSKKIRVTFIAGIHGNEPISTDGMLYCIYQLAEKHEFQDLLNNVILQILPAINIDGRAAESRYNNSGIDLNRDLITQNAVESRNLKIAINKFDPHLVVDFHEYAPRRIELLDFDDCLTIPYDALFLYTGNLNVHSSIRNAIANELVEPAKKYLIENKRIVNDYFTTVRDGKELLQNMGGISSRSSATNYALQNRISLLIEIRGLTEKEKASKRRIETAFLCATSCLKTANENYSKLIDITANANVETQQNKQAAVVTSKPQILVQPFRFIDVCKLENKIIDFTTRYNQVQIPLISRERPAAYIISPCSDKVKQILTISGIEWIEIKKPFQIKKMETYQLLTTKEIKLIKQEDGLVPAGSVLIKMQQAMGNTAVDLIEPEGGNSLFTNGLFKKNIQQNKLPVLRINDQQLLQLKYF